MLIRLGYDIQFDIPASTPMVALLHVHPSRDTDLMEPDLLHIDPQINASEYIDGFGQSLHAICGPAGRICGWTTPR